jgi:hypothetical protein
MPFQQRGNLQHPVILSYMPRQLYRAGWLVIRKQYR